MNPETSSLLGDANEEVFALIETLHKTGRRLEELTGGEVDTVADREGRTLLLPHAQEQLRHIEAGRQAAILNALPAHVALLDATGVIVSVNDTWRRFSCTQAIQGPGHSTGLNYLEICDGAGASSEARQVAAGIRSVLGGGVHSFSIEFACASPTQQRWFLLTATPLAAGRPGGAVIMHVDVTAKRRTEQDLRASEARFRQMAENAEQAYAQFEQSHEQLMEASRRDGMAEVATSVLHNVGNVLNSVNVSASLVAENVKNSRAGNMAQVVAMLREHQADLGSYLTSDPKGRHIPAFLQQLAQDWLGQQQAVVAELDSLRANIDHIKEIVALQQTHAKPSGSAETVIVSELVEASLRMNADSLNKHAVRVVREFEKVPPISVEKHKVLQILVNLVRNAKQACNERQGGQKRMTLRIALVDGRTRISVSDNGAGIAPENLTRIFAHGFTTRKDGHGFGLHSGSLAATELGGSLSAYSDGPGKGATFTLELARQPLAAAA